MKLSSLSLDSLAALAPREKRILGVGAVLAVLLFIFAVLLPLDRGVAHAQQCLAKKKVDLAWMQGAAPEVATLPAPPVGSGESLLVIFDRSARESGLGKSFSTEPGSAGSLSVRMEKASFDLLIGWLGMLAQQNGVVVDSATIEKAGAPGLVNAAIVLHAG